MVQLHLLTATVFQLFVSVSFCYYCSSDEKLTDDDVPKYCYQQSKHDLVSCEDIPHVTWYLLNSTTGSYNLEFPLLNCRYDLTFDILVNESLSEEQCNNGSFSVIHSKKKYEIKHCTSTGSGGCVPKCSDNGTLRFNFLYTSCYQVKVRQIDKTLSMTNTYVKTNYTKQLLSNNGQYNNLLFRPKYDSEKKQLTFTVVDDEYVWVEKTIISMSFNQKLFWGLTIYPNESMHITTGETPNIYCKRDRTEREGKVICTIKNVTEGDCQLCIGIKNTDRCQLKTLWTANGLNSDKWCRWPYDDNACKPKGSPEVLDGEKRTSSDTYYYITVIVVVSVILLSAIIYGTLKFVKLRLQPSAGISSPAFKLPDRRSQKLLLLYARDCPPFMKLIESFRHLLEGYSCFEVFDCYDKNSQHWDEISRNPSIWMQSLVEQRDVKIVVVASECAYLRQQAMLTNESIRYVDPDAMDRLFIPALHYLNESLTRNDYGRVFVVRFEGFSDDRILFAHINEYTRFALPQHYHQLVNCLKEVVDSQEETELSLQALREDLINLITFVDLNKNYLESLLCQSTISV